jgi:hypothetical protein
MNQKKIIVQDKNENTEDQKKKVEATPAKGREAPEEEEDLEEDLDPETRRPRMRW